MAWWFTVRNGTKRVDEERRGEAKREGRVSSDEGAREGETRERERSR